MMLFCFFVVVLAYVYWNGIRKPKWQREVEEAWYTNGRYWAQREADFASAPTTEIVEKPKETKQFRTIRKDLTCR